MAEKKERTKDIIYVFTQEQVCKICDGKRHGICDCCYWKEMPHLSSQEAIKKISSHLLMCDISTMDTDELAEAALNALLEGKSL